MGFILYSLYRKQENDMSKKEFYAIGHITNDILPEPHVGGGVSYTAYAAKQLGYDAHIVTKAPEQSRFVRELQALGIIVHCLPLLDTANAEKVTTFANIDDAQGRRLQFVSEVQETIGLDDLKHFPDMPSSSLVMVAPVIGEVEPDLLETLSLRRRLAATPQGYFRFIRENSQVVRETWKHVDVLQHVDISIMSNEDLCFGEPALLNEQVKSHIQHMAPMSVITEGGSGSEIGIRDKANKIHIEAFELSSSEIVDLTGAGDTYAFAFISHLSELHDPVQAGAFASLYAALKIGDLANGGIGLSTVPNRIFVEEFIAQHSRRYQSFLAKNGLHGLDKF